MDGQKNIKLYLRRFFVPDVKNLHQVSRPFAAVCAVSDVTGRALTVTALYVVTGKALFSICHLES